MRKSRILRRTCFTLIEILVVIVIILILAGMLFPIIKMAAQKADRASTIDRLQTLQKALNEYEAHFGFYPRSSAGTTAIALSTTFLDDAANWKAIPKYSGATPSDSYWGKFASSGLDGTRLTDPYEGSIWYLCPGVMNPETFDLWSMGPDEAHGDGGGSTGVAADIEPSQTRTDNDDVTNWKSDFK
jgi:general secretion pathway protein G